MSDLELYNFRVKSITRVVDGDTFDCIIDLGFDVLLEGRVRMLGIDTPESRTSNIEEKVFGQLSKDWLKKELSIEDATIIIQTQVDNEKGKFGRILGTVFVNGKNLNEAMIKEHMAVAYFGQNKDDVQNEHMKNRQILKEQGKV